MLLQFKPRKTRGSKSIILSLILIAFVFSMSVQAQNDLWIPKEDLGGGAPSVKRTGAVSFAINGKVYIALGKDGSTYFQDLWSFDTVTETWTQKANFTGAGRSGAFAMVMNNKAIVGTGETSGGSRTNTVFKYEPGTNTWTALANFSGGVRSFASAFSMGTRGFVVGGDDGSFRNDLWEYNINTNTWIGRQPFPGVARMKAVAFTIGTLGYYGTGDIGAATPSKDFWEYNIVSNNWTQLTDFPGNARVGAIGAATATTGYLGLGNDGAFLSDFWSFEAGAWTQQSDFPANARELAVAAATGNKIYAGTGFGGNYYKDFYKWDPCAVPQIIVQPVGLSVCEGTDISFTVEISNTGGETYQWLKNATPVSGATSNTLDIAAVTEAEEGSYTCEITNTCGTSVSDVALLSVTPIPINPPTDLYANPDTLCPGNPFDITLTATNNGDPQDTLRWYSTACGGDLLGSGFPVSSQLVVPAPNPLETTLFFARWENQCGASECDTVTIFVKQIAVEPTSISRSMDTICHNYNDELFLIAEGGSGDSLVWYQGNICTNPNALRLGTGDTLDLFALGIIPGVTRTYSARWETYCGGDEFNSTCLTTTITVNGAISIAQHPQNKSVCEGTDPVKFGVLVNEGTSLTTIFYQWYFNGLAISGATLDTLTLSGGVTPSDSGYYYCKVHNTCDTINSDSAHLRINLAPSIILQPFLLDTICQGDSVTFNIQAEGSPVLQYQWYFNNVPTAVQDTFYTINPTTFSNSGDYFCKVTNGCGTINSDTISMEVDTIPIITQQPEDQIVCLNGTAQFNVAAHGTMPIGYQWYKIDNAGNSTLLTGETGTSFEISPVLQADTAFNYYCIVSNECFDGPSSDTVNLEMYAQIHVMDSIISDTNYICYTYQTYIHLTAFGGEGDSIRWFTGSCDGTEIAVTADTTISIEVPDQTTTFFARWENPCGISACDSLTIYVSQEPIAMDSIVFEDNNICYNAYDSLLLVAYGGYGDSIEWYAGLNCNGEPFAVTADTFVYVHNLPINDYPYAAKWVNACGESDCIRGDLYINNFTLILDQTTEVEVCENTMAEMFVNANGTEPLFYQWYYNGVQLAGMTNDILSVGPVTFADTGQYYCQVRSECDTVISDSIPLYMLELPYYTLQPYDIAVCEGDSAAIEIKVAGDYPILVQWYENGIPIGGSTLLDTLLIINPAVNTAEYFARLSNGCGNLYSDTATLLVFDTIIITQQPEYQNLCLLDTARFSIAAEVTEYAHYKWYKVGVTNPLGSGTNFQIPNLDYPDQGLYYCIVSDTCGEISSDTVSLNMNVPPKVITDPFGATVCQGTLFQFEVIATGDSLIYQWFHNNVPVPNEDQTTLVFDPVERGDEGIYFVSVTNNCGDDESVPVNLFVNYLPDPLVSVTVFPDTVCTVEDFEDVQLIATGDGGGYGDYIEWYADGCMNGNIIGVGSEVFTPRPSQTTIYYAQWVNGCSTPDNNTCISTQLYFLEDPRPVTSITVDTNNICFNYGDSIVLTGIGGFGDRLDWYINMGSSMIFQGSGTVLQVPQPLDTTIYSAVWTNKCGESDSVNLQVNVVPLPDIYVKSNDTICAMQPYKIDSLMTFANYYDSIRWFTLSSTGYFDDPTNLAPTYYNPAIDVYDTVVQYLILKAYAISACDDATDTIKLVYTPLPRLTYLPEITAICRDSLITLEASGAESYIWRPLDPLMSDEDSNPLTISPVITTDFYLIGTNIFTCQDSVLFSLDVYPTPLVDLGDSTFIYSCEPVQLDAGGGDGSEYYIWSNGNRTRSITVYETGNYSVIVGNPGCEVSDTGYISLCNGRMFMPNAFTPNQDGINETLKPITSDPTIEFHMMVFDRWGKMLFETYDLHEGWDGDVNGEPCPAGNYVWRIEYQGQGTDSPGKKASEVGTVMLVR